MLRQLPDRRPLEPTGAKVTTAGQDAMALAERSAQALDQHAAGAGALETLGADSAQTVTTSAGAVHQHAQHQAEQAGADAQATSRSLSSPTVTTISAQHSALAQLEQATRVVADASLASDLTSKMTELVRHAADVSAASELELLTTADAARRLLENYADVRAEPLG